jgi:hypothetical protein
MLGGLAEGTDGESPTLSNFRKTIVLVQSILA